MLNVWFRKPVMGLLIIIVVIVLWAEAKIRLQPWKINFHNACASVCEYLHNTSNPVYHDPFTCSCHALPLVPLYLFCKTHIKFKKKKKSFCLSLMVVSSKSHSVGEIPLPLMVSSWGSQIGERVQTCTRLLITANISRVEGFTYDCDFSVLNKQLCNR